MATPIAPISLNDVKNTLNEGISTNYLVSSPITFNDNLLRKMVGGAFVTDKSSISMKDMRSKAGPTPYGSVISSSQSCSGTTLNTVQTLADGKYGTYQNTIVTPNSTSCSFTTSPAYMYKLTNVGNADAAYFGGEVPITFSWYTRDTSDTYSTQINIASGSWASIVLNVSSVSITYYGGVSTYSDAYTSWQRYDHVTDPRIRLYDKNGLVYTSDSGGGQDTTATVPGFQVNLSAANGPYWLRYTMDFWGDNSRGYTSPGDFHVYVSSATAASYTLTYT